MLRAAIPIVDEVLALHAGAIGGDREGYRNHVYRVVHTCVALAGADDAAMTRIATAAAFHDLGIWTSRTFDYLEPSIVLAESHLRRSGQLEAIPEVTAMIREHHKLSRYRGDAGPLVEPFREADWIDVSVGLLTFGLPGSFLRELRSAWPNAGFHRTLVRLSILRAATHPLSPLPMMRI